MNGDDPYALPSFPGSYTQMGNGEAPVDDSAWAVYGLPGDPNEPFPGGFHDCDLMPGSCPPVAGAGGQMDSVHTSEVTELQATVKWRVDYDLFSWAEPETPEEAREVGNQDLYDMLDELANMGLQFGQVGPVRVRQRDDWVYDDWEFEVDINLLSVSSSVTNEHLAQLVGTQTAWTPGQPLPGHIFFPPGYDPLEAEVDAFLAGTVGGLSARWWAVLALAGMGTVTGVHISWNIEEFQELAESTLVPLAVIALLFLATKAK